MAITPYDQAMWSQYTPLSGQEILQPAMMMRERQDTLDNEYAELNDITQQLAFIAENEPDPLVKSRYNNYMAQVEQGMDSIRDRGITPNSRREMLALRSRFQSELLPLKQGYDLKLQDINTYNQMKLKDPSWIGPDPSQRNVSDYINNGLQPMAQQGVSGEDFARQAGEMASQFKHILNADDPTPLMVDQFGAQYQAYMTGLHPDTPTHDVAAQYIKDIVLQANMPGLEWAMNENGEIDPSVYSAIDNQMNRGLVNTMNKPEILKDSGREYRMSMEAEKQRAAAAAQGDPEPAQFNKYPGRSYVGDRGDSTVEGKNKNLIKAAIEGSVNRLYMTSEKDKNTYKKAIELQDTLGNMTDAEIDAYFENPNNKVTWSGRSTDLVTIPRDRDVTGDVKEAVKVLRDYNKREAIQANMVAELGMSPEDAEQMTDSYITNTSTLYGIDFQANDEKLSKGELAQLESSKNRIFSAESGTVFYIDGKKVDAEKVKKKYGQDMTKDANILGYSTYNPNTGGATANYNYVGSKGEVIVAEVPEINLSNTHQASNAVLQNILKSNTPTPRNINLPSGEEVKVFSDFDGQGWQHYIEIGGQTITLDQLENMEQQGIARNWLERSKTIAQAGK